MFKKLSFCTPFKCISSLIDEIFICFFFKQQKHDVSKFSISGWRKCSSISQIMVNAHCISTIICFVRLPESQLHNSHKKASKMFHELTIIADTYRTPRCKQRFKTISKHRKIKTANAFS